MKYFNDDTINHFQFESNDVSKKEIQKQGLAFQDLSQEIIDYGHSTLSNVH